MVYNGPAIKGVSVPAFWPKKRDAVPRRSEASNGITVMSPYTVFS